MNDIADGRFITVDDPMSVGCGGSDSQDEVENKCEECDDETDADCTDRFGDDDESCLEVRTDVDEAVSAEIAAVHAQFVAAIPDRVLVPGSIG